MVTQHPASTIRFGASLVALVCGGALMTAAASLALEDAGQQQRSTTRDAVVDQPPGGAVRGVAAAAGASPRLAFSTFLGGQEWDEATGVDTDAQGNTVVAGFTVSRNF